MAKKTLDDKRKLPAISVGGRAIALSKTQESELRKCIKKHGQDSLEVKALIFAISQETRIEKTAKGEFIQTNLSLKKQNPILKSVPTGNGKPVKLSKGVKVSSMIIGPLPFTAGDNDRAIARSKRKPGGNIKITDIISKQKGGPIGTHRLIVAKKLRVLIPCDDYRIQALMKLPLETLIKLLPIHTQNGEQFGLKIMVCNGNKWSTSYFSHYSNSSDDRIPALVSSTPKLAVIKMITWFRKNLPEVKLNTYLVPKK